MMAGLVVYGGSLFLYLVLSHYMNFLLLALEGIGLALTMVPCMKEIKNCGANAAGAAFVYEMGYSLNIFVWGILHKILSTVFDKTWIWILIECLIAIGFAVLYFLMSGGKFDTKGSKKYT